MLMVQLLDWREILHFKNESDLAYIFGLLNFLARYTVWKRRENGFILIIN